MGLSGVVLLDKPKGITSRKAVDIVLKTLGEKKGGHFGSLDPFATGLLCIGIGNGTKLLPFMEDNIKAYIATVGLEMFTDTDDITGHAEKEFEKINFDRIKFKEWLTVNSGEIIQVPPVYCAQKLNGKPLYRLKRQNKEVSPRAKKVTIHKIEVISIEDSSVEMKIICSRGTYIRSLARNMGEYLGCGGYLRELRRLDSEGFSIKDALTIEELKQEVANGKNILVSLVDAIKLPVAKVNAEGKEAIIKGKPVQMSTMLNDVIAEDESFVAMQDEVDNLLCVARVKRSGGIFGYIERGFF
jgi:tRNA pseudouridine55 synthase